MPSRIEATGEYYTTYMAGDYLAVFFDGYYVDDQQMFVTFDTAALYVDIATALVTQVEILIRRSGSYPGKNFLKNPRLFSVPPTTKIFENNIP